MGQVQLINRLQKNIIVNCLKQYICVKIVYIT